MHFFQQAPLSYHTFRLEYTVQVQSIVELLATVDSPQATQNPRWMLCSVQSYGHVQYAAITPFA